MTQILYVYGGDYAALEFERSRDAGKVDPKVLWDQSVAATGGQVFEEGDTYFEYDALLFEGVDPDFIEFVKSELLDYDGGKGENIYVVGD